MGLEAACRARYGDAVSAGTARLETTHLRFRGEFRIAIPLAEIVSAESWGGWLTVRFPGGEASFDLGPASERWASQIHTPRSRLDKLGIKPGLRVAVLGVDDERFVLDLRERGAQVSVGGEPPPETDLIFLAAGGRDDLGRLGPLQRLLKRNGAIWVVRPKGRKEITEADVMTAGRRAGLVDTKVVSFSGTHTAEKLVIPVAHR